MTSSPQGLDGVEPSGTELDELESLFDGAGQVPADPLTKPRRTTVIGLAALVAGRAGAPTVLLLPGFTGSKEDFLPVLPRLAAAGLRAVAVDQRGQFESAGDPDLPDSQYGLDALAADVAAAAAELGGPLHLVGHSFGGLVSRAALLAYPEALASVTFLSSGPAAISGLRGLALRALFALYQQGGLPAVWEAAKALDASLLPPADAAFQRRRFFANSDRALLVAGQILLDEPDRVREAAAVAAANAVPLLVTHGAGDDAWLAPVQADMATRLGARYRVIPDALHSPAVQNPAGTAEALSTFVRDAVASAAV